MAYWTLFFIEVCQQRAVFDSRTYCLRARCNTRYIGVLSRSRVHEIPFACTKHEHILHNECLPRCTKSFLWVVERHDLSVNRWRMCWFVNNSVRLNKCMLCYLNRHVEQRISSYANRFSAMHNVILFTWWYDETKTQSINRNSFVTNNEILFTNKTSLQLTCSRIFGQDNLLCRF